MQAAGLDGIEIECYGHLLDGFWSPLTNRREDELRRQPRQPPALHPRGAGGDPRPRRAGLHRRPAHGRRRGRARAASRRAEGIEIARRMVATGHVDFLNIIRGMVDSDNHLADVIPLQGMRATPASRLRRRGAGRDEVPGLPRRAHQRRRHRPARHRDGQARHGRHDAGAHRRPAHRAPRSPRAARRRSAPASAPPIASAASTRATRRSASTTPRPAARRRCRTRSRGPERRRVVVSSAPARRGWRPRGSRPSAATRSWLFEAQDRPGGQVRLIARSRRRAEMIGIVDWRIAELERLGRRAAPEHAGRARRRAGRRRRISSSSRPAACPTPRSAPAPIWRPPPGTCWPATPKPGGEVLVFDDHGQEQALQAAEFLAEAGSSVELVTPERTLGADVSGLNHVPYARAFAARGVRRDDQHPPGRHRPPRQPAGARRSARTIGGGTRSARSTRWSSSTARVPATSSTSPSSRCRGTSARSTSAR